MGLPNYPGTERAWLDRVKNENWACVEFRGQGRGGIRREYTPPPEVQALIEARQRGELPAAAPARLNEQYRMVPSLTELIDQSRLREAFILTERAAAVQPLTPVQRAEMALSFYQHLTKGDEKQT